MYSHVGIFRVQTSGQKYMNVASSINSTSLKDRFLSFVFEYRHGLVGAVGALGLYVLWMDVRIVPLNMDGFYIKLACAVTGTILVLAGVGIRLWAGLYIGGHKNSDLITHGPYSLIRNPLYAGNLISALGVMVMAQSLAASLVVLIGLSVIYVSTIAHEEKKLLKFFGEDYSNYLSSTPRMIPERKALRALLSGGETTDCISYRNLARELKRGGVFLTTGLLVLLGMSVIH